MSKYIKIIKQLVFLLLFIVAFVLGYGLAMLKLSAQYKRAPVQTPPQNQDCAPKPALSFKKIIGNTNTQTTQAKPKLLKSAHQPQTSVALSSNGAVNSLSSLKLFLDELSTDNFDIDKVRDYLDSSSEAFQFITSQYRQLQDPTKKELLLDLISETDNPDKVAFAQEFVNASSVAERKRAYSWLADSEQNNASQNALLSASYYEEDPQALGDIVSALSVVDLDSQVHTSAVTRLSELSFHENPDVAAHAINVVSGISQDESTLTMLNSHINGANENLKIAALNGLYYFDGTSGDTRDNVAQILNDSSASDTVKEIASELLSVWSQNQQVEEGNAAQAEDEYYSDSDD